MWTASKSKRHFRGSNDYKVQTESRLFEFDFYSTLDVGIFCYSYIEPQIIYHLSKSRELEQGLQTCNYHKAYHWNYLKFRKRLQTPFTAPK